MKIDKRLFVQIGLLVAGTCLFVGVAAAKDLQVTIGKPHSVSIVKAEAIRSSGGEIVIVGLLDRPHRLPMTGHVHAYALAKNGELIGQSKHRIAGLNSQRGGVMRIPCRISIKSSYDETNKIFLEYHAPGHVEG